MSLAIRFNHNPIPHGFSNPITFFGQFSNNVRCTQFKFHQSITEETSNTQRKEQHQSRMPLRNTESFSTINTGNIPTRPNDQGIHDRPDESMGQRDTGSSTHSQGIQRSQNFEEEIYNRKKHPNLSRESDSSRNSLESEEPIRKISLIYTTRSIQKNHNSYDVEGPAPDHPSGCYGTHSRNQRGRKTDSMEPGIKTVVQTRSIKIKWEGTKLP